MDRFQETFPNRKRVLLPVIHCITESQAQRAIDVALENGADGVWLINQGGMTLEAVVTLAISMVRVSTAPFVGVNPLGMSPVAALLAAGTYHLHGLWTDDAGVRNDSKATLQALGGFRAERERLGWKGLYFGGVAFKYQTPVPLESVGPAAYVAALGGVDVVTTSGVGTGHSPDVEKVELMAEALVGHSLAIASGITPDNMERYLPFPNVRAFLVATGIESAFGELDAAKVRALAEKVHA